MKSTQQRVIFLIMSVGFFVSFMVLGYGNVGRAAGTDVIATVIGGHTLGVGPTPCCNGITLQFSSINPIGIFILDGEALFIPGISRSYMNYRETVPGFCTLGSLTPMVCQSPLLGCTSGELMPVIVSLGTGGMICLDGAASLAVPSLPI